MIILHEIYGVKHLMHYSILISTNIENIIYEYNLIKSIDIYYKDLSKYSGRSFLISQAILNWKSEEEYFSFFLTEMKVYTFISVYNNNNFYTLDGEKLFGLTDTPRKNLNDISTLAVSKVLGKYYMNQDYNNFNFLKIRFFV